MRTPSAPPRVALAALLVSAFATGACATAGEPRFGESPAANRATALVVTNRAWSDIEVYQADGSSPVRLGLVPALRSGTMIIRSGGGSVRLLIRPLASRESLHLDPVWVAPGQVLELVVQPMLKASELGVRWRIRL